MPRTDGVCIGRCRWGQCICAIFQGPRCNYLVMLQMCVQMCYTDSLWCTQDDAMRDCKGLHFVPYSKRIFVKSNWQLSISCCIVYLLQMIVIIFFFSCNLSIRIVFASHLSFNNWFFKETGFYCKIQIIAFSWISIYNINNGVHKFWTFSVVHSINEIKWNKNELYT